MLREVKCRATWYGRSDGEKTAAEQPDTLLTLDLDGSEDAAELTKIVRQAIAEHEKQQSDSISAWCGTPKVERSIQSYLPQDFRLLKLVRVSDGMILFPLDDKSCQSTPVRAGSPPLQAPTFVETLHCLELCIRAQKRALESGSRKDTDEASMWWFRLSLTLDESKDNQFDSLRTLIRRMYAESDGLRQAGFAPSESFPSPLLPAFEELLVSLRQLVTGDSDGNQDPPNNGEGVPGDGPSDDGQVSDQGETADDNSTANVTDSNEYSELLQQFAEMTPDGEVALQLARIVSDTSISREKRAIRACELNPQLYLRDSPWWAERFNISRQAVEKWKFWKEDRKDFLERIKEEEAKFLRGRAD